MAGKKRWDFQVPTDRLVNTEKRICYASRATSLVRPQVEWPLVDSQAGPGVAGWGLEMQLKGWRDGSAVKGKAHNQKYKKCN